MRWPWNFASPRAPRRAPFVSKLHLVPAGSDPARSKSKLLRFCEVILGRYAAYMTLTLKLALRRLGNRLGLTLLCLLGICLSVGLVVAIPVFSELVSRMVLRQELTGLAAPNNRPLFTLRYYCLPSTSRPMSVDEAGNMGAWLANLTAREIGLPIRAGYWQAESPGFLFKPGSGDSQQDQAAGSVNLFNVAFVSGAEPYIEVVEGSSLRTADEDSQRLEVWVQEPLAVKLGLNVGDLHRLTYFAAGKQQAIPIRIAGIWRPRTGSEGFWYGDPTKTLQDDFLTTRKAYQAFVEPRVYEKTGFDFWYFVLDDNRMLLDKVDSYAKGLEQVKRLSAERLPRPGLDLSPIDALRQASKRKQLLTTLLYGLSLPVLGLLYVFLGLVSSTAVRYERGEAAMLASRGASSLHILGISLAEALILAVVGFPLSLLTGYGLSRLAGHSYDFLAFGPRVLPPTGLQGIEWRYVLLALAVTILTRLVPAAWAARKSVVAYERERSRPRISPPWLRLTLVVALALATGYAFRQLRLRGSLGVLSWEPSGSPLQDPLVFLAPTLFLFTGAMLVSSIFPLLMRLGDWFSARVSGISAYLGARNLSREGGQYASALFLVIVCLAIGSFQASMAESANRWFVDRLRYRTGADFTFQPVIDQSLDPLLLPVSEYRDLPGVLDATRVGDFVGEIKLPGASNSSRVRILGVDWPDFARVTYWRRDYATAPLGALMNSMGSRPDALIVPRSMLGATGLSIGDKIRLDISVLDQRMDMEFTIVGVCDYFPTMFADERPALVANLDYVSETAGGVLPYAIWLRTAPGTDGQQLKEEIENFGFEIGQISDLAAQLGDDRLRLERVGVFGMLSTGFLASACLATLGLLTTIFVSLASRVQRFAVLRALGFGLNHLMIMVTLEFVTVVVYGVISGAALGALASKAFVPYFQLTESPSLPVPPFMAEIAWGQIGSYALAFSVVLLFMIAALLYGVARRQLALELRLGDQE